MRINLGTWEELPAETKNDLTAWFNQAGELDIGQMTMLAALAAKGQFRAWDCPECGNRVYEANPDSWFNFQGTEQVDYTSYPGDERKFTPEYLLAMCDACRATNLWRSQQE